MQTPNDTTFLRNLGDGLILRRSTAGDADKLSAFNALIHGDDGPDERVGQWARDLLELPHPSFGVHDFTIVEEASTGKIVSSLNLISQTWSYEDIPFRVGRPELVGTLPEYRKRGLVRIQFEEIHRWSADQGEMVQVITGIPYYYRMYGYEMCVDLAGSRSGYYPNLPKLPEATSEPFRLRPAEIRDIPFLAEVNKIASRRSLLNTVRDEAVWQYELTGRSQKNVHKLIWMIIERSSTGEAVGYLAHPPFSWGNCSPAIFFELKAGTSWLEVTPTIARWLWKLGMEICEKEGKTCELFTFALGSQHPAYEVFRSNLPKIELPYAWYLRVPDLAVFLQHISPVLEKRLTNSLIPGYSGELKINFFTHGLQLFFAAGKLITITPWQPDSKNEGDISFPNHSFLQLLFGHRGLDDLKTAYADCFWEKDETRILINTLFPRKPSRPYGVA